MKVCPKQQTLKIKGKTKTGNKAHPISVTAIYPMQALFLCKKNKGEWQHCMTLQFWPSNRFVQYQKCRARLP